MCEFMIDVSLEQKLTEYVKKLYQRRNAISEELAGREGFTPRSGKALTQASTYRNIARELENLLSGS